MKRYVAGLMLICLITKVSAQVLSTPSFGEKPSLNFKLAPLTIAEPYYDTFEGALEYKFHPKYSFQAQFGYGDSKISIYNYDETWDGIFRTYRSRVEGRYYPQKIRMRYLPSPRRAWRNPAFQDSEELQKYFNERRKFIHPYWAVELGWKNTVFFEEGFVGKGCSQGVCDYQEYTTYQRIKNVGMIYFKYGKQRFYGRNFFLDYYVGLGLRYVHIRLSEGEENPNFFFTEDTFSRIDARDPGSFFVPGIVGGIKLGYSVALKK
ncbi:MAG: hypothetical protein NW226_24060 [Microscillaceae bacterium]|nr:hypothetical protein [Microscillaceae bacterium]